MPSSQKDMLFALLGLGALISVLIILDFLVCCVLRSDLSLPFWDSLRIGDWGS